MKLTDHEPNSSQDNASASAVYDEAKASFDVGVTYDYGTTLADMEVTEKPGVLVEIEQGVDRIIKKMGIQGKKLADI
jgi:hypothetical protein